MAFRAILRRKRFLFDYLNVPARSIQSFSSFGHGQSSHYMDSRGSRWVANPSSADIDRRKEEDVVSAAKGEFLSYAAKGFLRSSSCGISTSGVGDGRLEFVSPLGIRWMSYSIRNASTATAGQPELGGGNEGNEEKVAKQIKEPSPEECDQAVEGLSTAKAKAKAKKLQEPPMSAKSIMRRLYSMLLGIGPALRVVASMSREDWAKKLRHWKDEFVSTLQHYWLGTKLLWVDVRISSRLLLKLASGKSLSRRERQQLTRTTADIFRTR